jgi:hypothetical protein
MKHPAPKEGEWVQPVKRGYKFICCDCGLVHTLDFEHIPCGRGRKVIFRAWRDEEMTKKERRQKK